MKNQQKSRLDSNSRTAVDNFKFLEVNDIEAIDIDTEDNFYMAEAIGMRIR